MIDAGVKRVNAIWFNGAGTQPLEGAMELMEGETRTGKDAFSRLHVFVKVASATTTHISLIVSLNGELSCEEKYCSGALDA